MLMSMEVATMLAAAEAAKAEVEAGDCKATAQATVPHLPYKEVQGQDSEQVLEKRTAINAVSSSG